MAEELLRGIKESIVRHYIEEDDLESLRSLLAKHPSLKNEALALASAMGKNAIITALLKDGGDANATLGGMVSALYLACQYGEHEIAKLLIKNGAKVNRRQCKDRYCCLYAAAAAGSLKTVKLLCENGAEIDAKDAFMHRTALFAASSAGHSEVVEYLLSRGAEKVEVCCICLDDLDGDMIAIDSCQHQFHLKCVIDLLKTGHNRCPLCRATFYVAYNETTTTQTIPARLLHAFTDQQP